MGIHLCGCKQWKEVVYERADNSQNTDVKRMLENMKKMMVLYRIVTGNYHPLRNDKRYQTR